MKALKHNSRRALCGSILVVTLTVTILSSFGSGIAQQFSPQTYLMFDGIDDYVQVADSPDFSVATTGVLTVSAWMKPATLYFPTTEGNGYIHWLGKGGRGEQEWAFRMYSKDTTHLLTPQERSRCSEIDPSITTRENRISFYLFNPEGGQGIGSYFQYCLNNNRDRVKAGEWIHVVGIVDEARTHIFRNGVRMDSDIYAGTIIPSDGTAPLRMGSREPGESHFLGGLAYIRIWNEALTPQEVEMLYQADVAGFDAIPRRHALVAEWLLNEETGSTVSDTTGVNHGTICGPCPERPGGYRPVR